MGWGESWGDDWGGSGEIYNGIPLATLTPERPGAVPLIQGQRYDALDGRTGSPSASIRDLAPNDRTEFKLMALNFTAAAAIRRFVRGVRGRLKPFWLPTYHQDLLLSTGTGSGESELSIKYCGYSVNLWPGSGARRHLWIVPITGAAFATKVEFAGDMLDGTEALSLLDPVPVTVGAKSRVMFLRLVRLDSDAIQLEWFSRGRMRVTLPIRELPLEAPL